MRRFSRKEEKQTRESGVRGSHTSTVDKATKQVGGEGELFLDSLDQMKKASKGELFENAVTHRCYAFWMLGVLTARDSIRRT